MTDLNELIKAIEAGTASKEDDAWFHLPLNMMPDGRMSSNMAAAWGAYTGSLDAALALHESLLHEGAVCEFRHVKRYADESYVYVHVKDETCTGRASNPARAWLIATLKAYRSLQG